MNVLIILIILTGAVAFIGTFSVSVNKLGLYYPYAQYEYSYTVFSSLGIGLIIGIAFPIIFGVLLITFWLLEIYCQSIAWLFRIRVIVCCLGQLCAVCACHALCYASHGNELVQNNKRMSDSQLAEFQDWLFERYPQNAGNHSFQLAVDDWNADMSNRLWDLSYNYSVFMGFTLIFETLVAIHLIGKWTSMNLVKDAEA